MLSMGVRYWAKRSKWALYSGIQIFIGILAVVLSENFQTRLAFAWGVTGFSMIAAGVVFLIIPRVLANKK